VTPEQARADPKRLVIDPNVPDSNAQNGDVFGDEDMFKDEGTVANYVYALTHTDAPALSEVKEWATNGDVVQLEKIVLDGRAHLLQDLQTDNPQTIEFLNALPQYQVVDR
jgi:hypothetical protein